MPIDTLVRHRTVLPFPPNIPVRCERDIREDGVASNDLNSVRIGFAVGAGHDTEISRFRIDGVEPAAGTRLHPCDIVADRPNFPPFVPLRWNEHRKVCFAASARECGCHVGFFTFRGFNTQDEHVFRHPTFFAREKGADAQRETLFPQERVSAVSRSDRENRVVLGKMTDVTAVRMNIEHAVQAAIEIGALTQMLQRDIPAARHDQHAQNHVK